MLYQIIQDVVNKPVDLYQVNGILILLLYTSDWFFLNFYLPDKRKTASWFFIILDIIIPTSLTISFFLVSKYLFWMINALVLALALMDIYLRRSKRIKYFFFGISIIYVAFYIILLSSNGLTVAATIWMNAFLLVGYLSILVVCQKRKILKNKMLYK